MNAIAHKIPYLMGPFHAFRGLRVRPPGVAGFDGTIRVKPLKLIAVARSRLKHLLARLAQHNQSATQGMGLAAVLADWRIEVVYAHEFN